MAELNEPEDNTCQCRNRVWMQGCQTCHDKEVLDKAVERVDDACRHERVYAGYVLCDACSDAIAAIRGEGERSESAN
jgi:hypothetical protein